MERILKRKKGGERQNERKRQRGMGAECGKRRIG